MKFARPEEHRNALAEDPVRPISCEKLAHPPELFLGFRWGALVSLVVSPCLVGSPLRVGLGFPPNWGFWGLSLFAHLVPWHSSLVGCCSGGVWIPQISWVVPISSSGEPGGKCDRDPAQVCTLALLWDPSVI